MRRYFPSVAPMTIMGTTGTPGQIFFEDSVIALKRSGRIGEAGPALDPSIILMVTSSSEAICFRADSTYSGESSGRTRQFTVAAASWGRAFTAWPPSSWVATQVVRRVALNCGVLAARRSIADWSPSATLGRSFFLGP